MILDSTFTVTIWDLLILAVACFFISFFSYQADDGKQFRIFGWFSTALFSMFFMRVASYTLLIYVLVAIVLIRILWFLLQKYKAQRAEKRRLIAEIDEQIVTLERDISKRELNEVCKEFFASISLDFDLVEFQTAQKIVLKRLLIVFQKTEYKKNKT